MDNSVRLHQKAYLLVTNLKDKTKSYFSRYLFYWQLRGLWYRFMVIEYFIEFDLYFSNRIWRRTLIFVQLLSKDVVRS